MIQAKNMHCHGAQQSEVNSSFVYPEGKLDFYQIKKHNLTKHTIHLYKLVVDKRKITIVLEFRNILKVLTPPAGSENE